MKIEKGTFIVILKKCNLASVTFPIFRINGQGLLLENVCTIIFIYDHAIYFVRYFRSYIPYLSYPNIHKFCEGYTKCCCVYYINTYHKNECKYINVMPRYNYGQPIDLKFFESQIALPDNLNVSSYN